MKEFLRQIQFKKSVVSKIHNSLNKLLRPCLDDAGIKNKVVNQTIELIKSEAPELIAEPQTVT